MVSLAEASGVPVIFATQDYAVAVAVPNLKQQSVAVTDALRRSFKPEAKVLYEGPPLASDVGAEVLPCKCHDFMGAEFHGRGFLARMSRVATAAQAAQLFANISVDSQRCAVLSASGDGMGQLGGGTHHQGRGLQEPLLSYSTASTALLVQSPQRTVLTAE